MNVCVYIKNIVTYPRGNSVVRETIPASWVLDSLAVALLLLGEIITY